MTDASRVDAHADILAALARGGPARHPVRALAGLLETCGTLQHWLERELTRSAHTEPGFRILARLAGAAAPGLGARDLARQLRLSPAAVDSVLGRLEVSGLIQRRCAPGNRRSLVISLTPAGRASFSAGRARLRTSLKRLCAALAAREITGLQAAGAHLARACTAPRRSPRRRPSAA
jgi:DNA-binding MarR family transcriptional regulator